MSDWMVRVQEEVAGSGIEVDDGWSGFEVDDGWSGLRM